MSNTRTDHTTNKNILCNFQASSRLVLAHILFIPSKPTIWFVAEFFIFLPCQKSGVQRLLNWLVEYPFSWPFQQTKKKKACKMCTNNGLEVQGTTTHCLFRPLEIRAPVGNIGLLRTQCKGDASSSIPLYCTCRSCVFCLYQVPLSTLECKKGKAAWYWWWGTICRISHKWFDTLDVGWWRPGQLMNETGNKPVAYKLVCLLNSSRHQLQVTDEPVVDGLRYNRLQFLQDFRKISHRFRGIYYRI